MQDPGVDREVQVPEPPAYVTIGIRVSRRAPEAVRGSADHVIAPPDLARPTGVVSGVQQNRARFQTFVEPLSDWSGDVRRVNGLSEVDELLVGVTDEFVRRRRDGWTQLPPDGPDRIAASRAASPSATTRNSKSSLNSALVQRRT